MADPAYDFHIHTCLSPCGDNDMTPNNIVNMALLKELDIIAVTDHNSVSNCEAVIKAADGTGLKVIPGMELCTAEEVHMVCLFGSLDKGKQFEEFVFDNLPDIKNRPEIFGEQIIMNEQDEKVGEFDKLLINASMITIDEAVNKVKELEGICYPAHIDKSSNSIISNLGFIPEEYGFQLVEAADLKKVTSAEEYSEIYKRYAVIHSSDAHYLWDISEREYFLTSDIVERVPFFKQYI